MLTASDGADGFSLFVKNQQEIDVVLTDVMMPIMDGPTMINALHRIAPNLPIIVASGVSSHGEGILKAHPGVTHFLTKPYNSEKLLTAVAAELKAKRDATENLRQPPSPG